MTLPLSSDNPPIHQTVSSNSNLFSQPNSLPPSSSSSSSLEPLPFSILNSPNSLPTSTSTSTPPPAQIPSLSPVPIPSPSPQSLSLPQLLLPNKNSPHDIPFLPFPRLNQPSSSPSPISNNLLPNNAHSQILINFFPPNRPLQLDPQPKQPQSSFIHNHNHNHNHNPTRYRTHSGVLEIRMPTLLPPGRPPSQSPAPSRLPLHALNSALPLNLASNPPGSPNPHQPSPLSAPRQPLLVLCCNGRLLSPSPRQTLPLARPRALRVPFQTLGSLSLLIGLGTVYMALVAPFLVRQSGGGALLAVFIYCWLLCLSAMAKTVSSDPGVLPRRLDPAPDTEWQPASDPVPHPHPDPNAGPEGEKPKLEVGEWALVPRWIKVEPGATSQLGATRIVEDQPSQGAEEMADERVADWVQSKWCNTCLSYRPPRSSHCRICDCCIDGIDHHCSYLNNCIGSRNYRSFFVFLVTSTMNLILIIGGTLWKLINESEKKESGGGEGVVKDNVGELVVLVLAGLLVVPIGALTVYHIFLTTKGLTTVEYIKAKTTRKVLKENSGLVEDFYGGGGGKAGGGGKMRLGEKERRSRSGSGRRRSKMDVIMWRLCRPDTDRFVGKEWSGGDGGGGGRSEGGGGSGGGGGAGEERLLSESE